MHVDPIKPMLNPPGTMRSILNHGKLLSSFAFTFNSRRYTMHELIITSTFFVVLATLVGRGRNPKPYPKPQP